MINAKKQQGAVLLIAMIFLIVITIIGVNAVSSSSIKTQVAGNNMSSMLVYTGAESTLAKSASQTDQQNLINSLAPPPAVFPVPAVYLPDENVSANAILTSIANITYLGRDKPCPVGSLGMGTASSSVMKCKIWTIDAQSRLRATNARDRHLLGVAISE